MLRIFLLLKEEVESQRENGFEKLGSISVLQATLNQEWGDMSFKYSREEGDGTRVPQIVKVISRNCKDSSR